MNPISVIKGLFNCCKTSASTEPPFEKREEVANKIKLLLQNNGFQKVFVHSVKGYEAITVLLNEGREKDVQNLTALLKSNGAIDDVNKGFLRFEGVKVFVGIQPKPVYFLS